MLFGGEVRRWPMHTLVSLSRVLNVCYFTAAALTRRSSRLAKPKTPTVIRLPSEFAAEHLGAQRRFATWSTICLPHADCAVGCLTFGFCNEPQVGRPLREARERGDALQGRPPDFWCESNPSWLEREWEGSSRSIKGRRLRGKRWCRAGDP